MRERGTENDRYKQVNELENITVRHLFNLFYK